MANERIPHLMKRTLLIALLVLAWLSVASSQTPNQRPSKEDRARNDLMQLERDIGKANIDGDYAFFDRVEAEERS